LIERLKKQIEFIIEIDKIKNIFRKSKHFYNNKFENDAEHSWHISTMAIILCEYANESIDILKVIKMLLIHDIVEIDAGDVIVYKKSDKDVIRERKAAERIFGLLPIDQKKEYKDLWIEFEKRESAEAKFAVVLDRLEPVMQNIYHKCESWNKHKISYERVIKLNVKINEGSVKLWKYIKGEIDRCMCEGLFRTK